MPPARPKPSVQLEFGRRVRDLRQRRGLSQMALADLAGMHFTYIGSLERGERNVALRNIVRLADALDVDPGRLLKGLRPDDN